MASSHKNLILSGQFSTAGKLSLKFYNIIKQQNRLKGKEKKSEPKYFLISNYSSPLFQEQKTVIYNTNLKLKKYMEEENDLKNSLSNSIILKNKNEGKNTFKGNNYKYYNLHQDKVKFDKKYGIQKKEKVSSISKGLYKTNLNYFNKRNGGIEWKKLTGRKELKIIKEKNDININILKNIDQNKIHNKCFINMSKQTERKGYPPNNNLRQRCEKKYSPINLKLEKENWLKFSQKPLIAVSPFINNTYEIFGYRRVVSPNINKNKKIYLKTKITSFPQILPTNPNINNRQNQFPYFPKYKSEINLIKSSIKKKFYHESIKHETQPILILHPNYNSIEERVKNMVVYNNKKTNKKNKNKFKGINFNISYDASKSFVKMQRHRLIPNFEKMISRTKDDKLPCFMKGISKGICTFLNTEKSLILKKNTDKNENYNCVKKKRKELINKLFGTKKENKKHSSKEILKKFNNLYIIFFRAIKRNKK